MPIEPGQTLSHYRLVEKIGEGGMGVVWKAEDTVLRRRVALKFLPAGFGDDADRLARFGREARCLAALNHSNIAAIHGLEEAEGLRFLVLELVPGASLEERLRRGAPPVTEALEICCEIARAVESAHEKGVIHRDLKPANVQLTPKGGVKVLDFGLAKVFEATSPTEEPSQQVTMTAATGEQTILGTTPYMSPEQATARPLDKRTDIWSFGCVLYETLTGQRAFPGETVSSTLAAIHGGEPDWDRLPARTPERIRELLRRCLAKDPDRRLHDIADGRIELEDALAGTTSSDRAGAASTSGVRGRRALAIVVGVLVVGTVIGTLSWRLWGPGSSGGVEGTLPTAVTRLSLSVPDGMVASVPMISPDGMTVLFGGHFTTTDGEGAHSLYTRRLDQFEPQLVEGSGDFWSRCFSPDGRWLALVVPVAPGSAKRQLVKIPVDGSAPPLRIADFPDSVVRMIDWLPGGDIVVLTARDADSGRQELVRFPTDGSPAPPPVELDRPESVHRLQVWPSRFPGDRHVLAIAVTPTDEGERWGTALLNVETGEVRTLIEEGMPAVWVPTGHILVTRFDTLLAIPFDVDRLETTGEPVAVMDGLLTSNVAGGAWYDVSANGTLVYQPGGIRGAGRRIVTLTEDLTVEPWLGPHDPPFEGLVTVSDDGKRLAAMVYDIQALRTEVWISSFERPRMERFVVGEGGPGCGAPVWSPDGQSLAYDCVGVGVYIRRIVGSEEPELVLEDGAPRSFSPDGSHLLISREHEVLLLPVTPDADGGRTPRTLLTGTLSRRPFSPDGHWIAYTSEESGREGVYVRAYGDDAALGPAVQITSGDENSAMWSRDSMELTYLTRTLEAMTVSITTKPQFVVSEPELSVRMRDHHLVHLEPLPDDRWIAVQEGPEEYATARFDVVQNWFLELEQKLDQAR